MPDLSILQELIEKIAPWLIIIGITLLFWRVPVWKTRIENSIEHIKDRIDSLESRFEKFEERIGNLESKFEKLENRFDHFKERIENRFDHFKERIVKLESKDEKFYGVMLEAVGKLTVQKSSPLNLTNYGSEISERIGATEIAKEYAKKLVPETEGFYVYQVQEFCFNFCKYKLMDDLKEKNPDQFKLIDYVAYEQGMAIDEITRIVGIELRDAIFSISETPHAHIDKHSVNVEQTN